MTTAGRSGPSLRSDDPVLADFAAEVATHDPVVARGRGTCWDLGGAVEETARVVTAPTGVVEYHPEEMTIQVRAGTTVADLDAVLAGHGQRSALPDRGGTVGGAVAVGHDDIRRRGRGTVAASVLQVRYVSADGVLVNGGGPTVKNVTGYDLPRLLVGSLGTIGLLAELILRTNPVPAVSLWLRSDDADPVAASDAVLRPGAVLWDGTTTWIELEGHPPDVDADRAALAATASWVETDGPPGLPPHRWSLAPAELAGLADDSSATGAFVASIGVGTVWAARPRPARPLDPGVAALARRIKDNFDPTGRLAPGRHLGRP